MFRRMVQQAADDPTFPTQHTQQRTVVNVVVDLPTLLGLADNPGEINGAPVPGPVARELAGASGENTFFRRLVTAPVTGHLLDCGPTYRPSAALTEFVLTRDRTCREPGCNRRAVTCDLDHATPHPEGGTSTCNLGALCRLHHLLKTLGWTDLIQSAADGTGTWITPLGRRYPIPTRAVLAEPEPEPPPEPPPDTRYADPPF